MAANSYNTIIKAYICLVILIGITVNLVISNFTFNSLSEWVLGYALIGAVLILNHHNILLPPEGNRLSMDSAIYLACVFVFGIETTMSVLLYSSLIFFFYERSTIWWKHLFNLASYTLMICASYYLLLLSGGEIGRIDISNVYAYIIALAGYFIVNLMLISFFFRLFKKTSLLSALRGQLRGAIESYLSTLLLALVLGFLLQESPFFGLTLFILITVLLSYIFKQHFELYKEVENKANIDHLTGLNNHGYFKELLTKTVIETKQSEAQLSMAVLDIDDFKKYNDTNGHLKGDNLLMFFGKLIEEKCASRNFMVARYGGEEFVILMPHTGVDDAAAFTDYLRKTVNDTYFEGVEILPYGCLSFSAGIAEWKKEMLNETELINHADQAMYYAKAQGKNNTHVYGKEIESLDIEKPLEELELQLKMFLARDVYTYRHSKRVFKYAVEYSKQLTELSDYEKKVLMLGALIHDIGKLEVPREVIGKKGKLTSEEWAMIKNHVIWGKEIVGINKSYQDILPLVELHHERFDGKGYPHGLSGEEIPKLARILCIIDSFDAMTTERPYQKTKSFAEAIKELRACTGTQFDPTYVGTFIHYIEDNYLNETALDNAN